MKKTKELMDKWGSEKLEKWILNEINKDQPNPLSLRRSEIELFTSQDISPMLDEICKRNEHLRYTVNHVIGNLTKPIPKQIRHVIAKWQYKIKKIQIIQVK